MTGRGSRRRVMAQINIVPYIDVMLVLLVIFMVTAPLLNQGVEVELPQAEGETLAPAEQRPLVLSIDRGGTYFLNYAADPAQPLDAESVTAVTAAVLRNNPKLPVLVRADKNLEYGIVIEAMVLLQRAGAEKVGLSTELPAQ